MRKRNLCGDLPSTSIIGLGGWGIGGATSGATSYGNLSEKNALDCISAAFDLGINLFDTAAAYGESEARLGLALGSSDLSNPEQKALREKVIICTKGGVWDFSQPADYSPISLQRILQRSLTRLQTDYVDVYQLHSPPADIFVQQPELVSFLERIKSTGEARVVGASVKNPEHIKSFYQKFPFETVQMNLNMLDIRGFELGVLDFCEKNNISVIARTPLCFGFLSLGVDENTQFADNDHRSNWSKEQIGLWSARAREAQDIAAENDVVDDAGHVSRAIRFCLSHPAVKVVLSGAMSRQEVTSNALAGSQPLLHSNCLKSIKQLHKDKKFFVK